MKTLTWHAFVCAALVLGVRIGTSGRAPRRLHVENAARHLRVLQRGSTLSPASRNRKPSSK